jgi:hypothetical protein
MDIPTLIEKWAEQGETLIPFPSNILTDRRLNDATRSFLAVCGLPESAAPFLDFPIRQDALLTVNQYFHLQGEQLDIYLVIGHNGSGDPICINAASNNEIVYLNHDNSFELVWMNSTVWQFCRSLLAYKIFYVSLLNDTDPNDFSTRRFSDTEFLQVQEEFRQIDEKALDKGTFWQMELEALLWERDH